jgi:hypothetical protein
MDIETVKPADRQSLITTLPPGNAPVIKDTKLYAFRSQTIPSRAYQSAAAPKPGAMALVLIADTSSTDRLISAPPITVLQMGERTSLPDVGAEFSGSGADVGAVSTVTREGSLYTFTMIVGRSGEAGVKEVSAPFASALRTKQTFGIPTAHSRRIPRKASLASAYRK